MINSELCYLSPIYSYVNLRCYAERDGCSFFWVRTTSFRLLVVILCCIATHLVVDGLKIIAELCRLEKILAIIESNDRVGSWLHLTSHPS